DNLLFEEDEDEGDEGILALGAITHWWLSLRAFLHRRAARRRRERDEFEPQMEPRASAWRRAAERVESAEFAESRMGPGRARVEPEFFAAMVNDRSASVDPVDEDFGEEDEDADVDDFDDEEPVQRRANVRNFRSDAATRVEAPAPRPVQGARVQREAQTSLIGSGRFEMPSLHFLSEPKNVARDPSLSKDALEQNARLLEGVLEDFGVKGEIIHVRPGPVVTLYELEPAPGIKSSRVIGLSDDIARSMSAIACRVAVVPGRNAIGIELPNAKRETVYLREIMASRDFETTKAKLALALGKTINGEAVIVDIAKMPHVLVAGTTGSGKSVAINTMILSLLYRLTPQECRLIMIDPKMLELSVYDGIPHLLTPVVTDPKKAVVALKWTVREMEDRYRKMSKVGVRNIDGFNARVQLAEKKGEKISRTVQTGFDRQTGEAIYETEDLDLEPMPYIVVIIDEMADLMMVAGKDIEGAVQRLAQMARAAGIHVIMATQRPSVDVITGTIKANFPTRISFQVTSKIDSRTILGEQGAEQLLGMGDMLYMAGGGRIQRVHGPFVSDDEVEKIVAHLKLQGVPEYLDAITEDDEEEEEEGSSGRGSGGGGGGNFEDSDDPYDQAVAVVLRDGKASTSYIQRRLGIGYNRAASIIEKMEKEGIVGPANHAGKREILVPTEDDKF
ncbi:DNA translocase FtsK, partial [Mesorhizobium sp.]